MTIDFSYCPVLEYLTIDGSLGDDGFNFNISVSELKTLRIRLSPGRLRDGYSFLINAPNLEKLDVQEGYLSNYTFENTKSLVEANVKVLYQHIKQDASANRATKFLAGISSVKYLSLLFPFYTVSIHYLASFFYYVFIYCFLKRIIERKETGGWKRRQDKCSLSVERDLGD